MRFLTRSLTGLFMLALTLGLLAWAAQLILSARQGGVSEGAGGPAVEERAYTAAVLPVTSGRITPELTVHGEVRAVRRLELRAPRAGRIVWLAEGFADGAAVAAGQLLVRLDPAEARASLAMAESDLARAGAELAEAEAALDLLRDTLAGAEARARLQAQALARQRDLDTRGVGSDAAVEAAALMASNADQAVLAARADLAAGEARVTLTRHALDRQRITLAEARRALAETEIRAGFAGRLNAVAVTVGGLVGANEMLAEVIDDTGLEVAIRLSAAQAARLLDPQGALMPLPLVVTLGESGPVGEGRLERIAAAVEEGQSGRVVFGRLVAAPGLRPGDFVTVTLQEPALEGVASLPAGAVGSDGKVLALGADDRLEALPVTVLRRQGDRVLIEAGPLVGREVVAERSPLFGAGIRILPVRPEAQAGG